jgi:hypothetical protein
MWAEVGQRESGQPMDEADSSPTRSQAAPDVKAKFQNEARIEKEAHMKKWVFLPGSHTPRS